LILHYSYKSNNGTNLVKQSIRLGKYFKDKQLLYNGFESFMEIKACPRCGSTRIFQGTMGDGVLTGYTSRQVCKNCGFQGMPLIFTDEQNYKKFLKGLTKEQSDTKSRKKSINEDKTITLRPKGLIFISVVVVIETIISLIIFLTYPTLFRFSNIPLLLYLLMFLLTGVLLPYGFIRGASWSFTVGGILFIFTIPFNLPLLYYITRPHVKQYLLKDHVSN
jgi:hypothetical protein